MAKLLRLSAQEAEAFLQFLLAMRRFHDMLQRED